MAQTVTEVIDDYQIRNKIGYFVLDNADSNDTCVSAILQNLNLGHRKAHRRLRCVGHIINLAAQALFWGDKHRDFEADLQHAITLKQDGRELDMWRKKGPFGKLHNIVKFIRITPQRREKFLSTDMPDNLDDPSLEKLIVMSDNATRWNSAHRMIARAIKLRSRIDTYCSDHRYPTRRATKDHDDGSLSQDTLTSDDWHTLTELMDILKPFEEATMELQSRGERGGYGAAWEVIPTIYHLLMTTRQKRNHRIGEAAGHGANSEDNFIIRALTDCIAKLEKYLGLLQQSPIYTAAMVMHPHIKWAFTSQKIPETLGPAQIAVQQIWDEFYKNGDSSHVDPSDPSASTSLPPRDYDTLDFFDLDDVPHLPNDPYQEYINAPRVPKDECQRYEVAKWWSDHKHMEVGRMAWDTLAIPAMSAECERVFSSASHLVSSDRNRLNDDTIEAEECLKAWYTQIKA